MKAKLLGITLVAALLSLLGSSTSSAATTSPALRFASQAAAAGLSPAQANALQRRMAGYLAINKGSQVAFNKINLNGGGEIELGYPGQVQPDFTCYVGDFCGYRAVNYAPGGSTDHFSKQACNSPVNIPYDDSWVGNGSYWNNQTGSVRARFYSETNGHGTVTYSKPAVAKVSPFDWTPVFSVEAC